MWLRLCLAFGVPTVEELQCRIDSRQFAEWMAFWAMEPWGAQIDDVRWSVTQSLVANALGGAKTKPSDFSLCKRIARQSPDEIERVMMSWARVHNRRVAAAEAARNRARPMNG